MGLWLGLGVLQVTLANMILNKICITMANVLTMSNFLTVMIMTMKEVIQVLQEVITRALSMVNRCQGGRK